MLWPDTPDGGTALFRPNTEARIVPPMTDHGDSTQIVPYDIVSDLISICCSITMRTHSCRFSANPAFGKRCVCGVVWLQLLRRSNNQPLASICLLRRHGPRRTRLCRNRRPCEPPPAWPLTSYSITAPRAKRRGSGTVRECVVPRNRCISASGLRLYVVPAPRIRGRESRRHFHKFLCGNVLTPVLLFARLML